jgi:hypothetical protein
MVYIYEKKVKNKYGKEYKYGYLCESIRTVDGKSSHRVIKYLGKDYDADEVMQNSDIYVKEFENRKSEINSFVNQINIDEIDLKSSNELYQDMISHVLVQNKFRDENSVFVKNNIKINTTTYSVKVDGNEASIRIGADTVDGEFLRNLHLQIKAIKGEVRKEDVGY